MYRDEPDSHETYFWTSAAFFIVLVLVIAAALVSFISAIQELERGRELTEQYCYGCHNFSPNEQFPSVNHPVDTSRFSDDELKQRIIKNPSGIFPEKATDQERILLWLRYLEAKDKAAKKK